MRRFPGAIALGLLAASLAHIVVYGNDHVMGGSYATPLRGLTLAGALALGVFWFAIYSASRGRLCQGSVLTATITKLLPSLSGIFAASLGWFSLAESIEDGHPWAPTGCILLTLLVVSAAVRLLAFASLRALAKIALVCEPGGGFKDRAPFLVPIVDDLIAGVAVVRALRLFSRPPPISFNY